MCVGVDETGEFAIEFDLIAKLREAESTIHGSLRLPDPGLLLRAADQLERAYWILRDQK